MLTGLVSNTGPTLNVPVPDSKDRNLETRGNKFSDVLGKSTNPTPKKDEVAKAEPDKATKLASDPVRKKSTEKDDKVKSQDDSENQTENLPDPKVMDPRTSALRAQRDRAIRKFMDSFESEFGVPPEEMVEAMSQLTTQDLEKPPEKTVDTLLAKLDLAPQDEAKAKQMYLGLVMQLKQIDTRVAMPQAHDDMLSQLSAQRVQLSSEKKDVMGSQVQNLSDKFWMRGSQADKALSPEMNQLQVREFLKKMVTAESAGVDGKSLEEPEAIATTENFMQQLKTEAPDESQDDSADTSANDDFQFMAETSGMKALERNESTKDAHAQGHGKDQQKSNDEAGAIIKGGISKEAIMAEFKKLGINPEHLQSKKTEKADVEALLNLDAGSLPQSKFESLKSILPALSIQPPVVMSAADKMENMQQVMNQAQILLKNGGGEVKVEMTPEGMGKVQLNLQMIDGKVQLHMNTETKEAKKLIESSISELKQSLAAHQLSMDLVKVDVVHKPTAAHEARNDQQGQMQNFLNQQQRDGTKQFWQQFNENFGNRQARENFFDAQNITSPSKNQTLPGIDRTTSNSRARSDGTGKSLNLVA